MFKIYNSYVGNQNCSIIMINKRKPSNSQIKKKKIDLRLFLYTAANDLIASNISSGTYRDAEVVTTRPSLTPNDQGQSINLQRNKALILRKKNLVRLTLDPY